MRPYIKKAIQPDTYYSAKKIQRGVNYIRILKAGGSVNPALLLVDTAIAVIECCNSVLKYERAKLVTQQLLTEIESIRNYIGVLEKKHDMMQEVIAGRIANDHEMIRQQKLIYDETGEALIFIKNTYTELKKSGYLRKDLSDIEKQYGAAVMKRAIACVNLV